MSRFGIALNKTVEKADAATVTKQSSEGLSTGSQPSTTGHVLAWMWHGAVVGASSSAVAGVVDSLLNMSLARQFVGGAAIVGYVVYVVLAYAIMGGIVGAIATGAVLSLYRKTRLGESIRMVARAHESRRAIDKPSVLPATAFGLAVLPSLAVSVAFVVKATVPFVSGRQSPTLVVMVVVVATLAAVAAAVPLGFIVGRVIEFPLSRVVRYPNAERWLTLWFAPLLINAGVVVVLMCAWLIRGADQPAVQAVRGPLIVVIVVLLTLLPLAHLLRNHRRWASKQRWWLSAIMLCVVPVAMMAALIVLGSSSAILKAESNYSALGSRITRVLRKPFDFDRDGYARWLGGGDCNDGDASVHPGAIDVAGDGIDQNCIGGDAVVSQPIVATFASLPSTVTTDARILLITIDATRADHLRMYGYARVTSPHLDRLALNSFVFSNAWSNAPATYFSMPAILTGRMPLQIHAGTALDGAATMAPEATTIAEALKPLGFASGAALNLKYFEPARGINQGFDWYDNSNALLHGQQGADHTTGSSSKQQTAKALEFVDGHRDQKWFLWVHYFDPHYGYENHPGMEFGSRAIDRYDSEIKYTDDAIGTLLDGLASRGLEQKTIVVVTSDHGETFGEHGELFHGNQLYAPSTKVPLLLHVPGMAGRSLTTPVSHVDIMPTIVNLAGGVASSDMQGSSMVDALLGDDHDRIIYQQLSLKGHRQRRAAVSRSCHVIYSRLPDVSWEVYRTDIDPMERNDLADSDECAATRQALATWCNDCD
jgi:arylsulfatase A-like enzyme